MSSDSKCSVDSLDRDSLANIFKFVEPKDRAGAVALVSKAWQETEGSNPLQPSRLSCGHEKITASEIRWNLRGTSRLTDLTLRGDAVRLFLKLNLELNQLVSLTLTHWHYDFPEIESIASLELLANLKSLRLEDVGACHFPSGKDEEEDLDASLEIRRVEIDLRYCAGDAFKRAVPAISGLTSLEFKEVDFVDDDLLDHDDAETSPWTHLKRLVIDFGEDGYEEREDVFDAPGLSNMTSLTELHIPVPVHYGDLLESLSLLQELTINFEAQSQDRPPPILISDAAVVTKFECNSMYLGRNDGSLEQDFPLRLMRNLKELYFENCMLIETCWPMSWSQLTNLTKLRCAVESTVPEAILQIRSLRKLDISDILDGRDSHTIRDSDVTQRLTRLTSLVVEGQERLVVEE